MVRNMLLVILVLLAASGAVAFQARYTANGDGTVTDARTGLTWVQSLQQLATGGWQSGLRLCADLSFGGRTDWRLPNVKELTSIVDVSKGICARDSNYFFGRNNDPAGGCGSGTSVWTSTTVASNPRPRPGTSAATARSSRTPSTPTTTSAACAADRSLAPAGARDPRSAPCVTVVVAGGAPSASSAWRRSRSATGS